MTKKLLLPSLFITLCSCVNTPSPSGIATGSPYRDSNELSVKKSPAPAQKEITGKKVFVDEKNAARLLSEETAKNIVSAIKNTLTEKGYILVDKRHLGHLTVYVQTTYADTIPESSRQAMNATGISQSGYVLVSETHKRIENGKVVLDQTRNLISKVAHLSIITNVNDYGRRPETLSWLTIASPEKEWTGYETNLEKEVVKQLKFLFLVAPEKNKNMKGNPGCLPRFGYEHENGKVIKVPKGSPAQLAGFKVGDTILSIDSESPDGEIDREVYETGIQVPVKLKRGEKIIRTSIKSKIMCED